MTKTNNWQVEIYAGGSWGTVGQANGGNGIVPYAPHVSRTLEDAILEMLDFAGEGYKNSIRVRNPKTGEVIPIEAL